MLVELRLKNMAVVADAQLHLGPGLQLLTGSTGAGKSIVVEALRWLRGDRIDRSLLRGGSATASAEAIFDLEGRPGVASGLVELGMDIPEDGVLRVRRELRANGRSYGYLGTQQTSASVLGAVVGELIQLQSQHQQLALLNPGRHFELLDACGVSSALREGYAQSRADFLDCQRRAEEFRREHARIERERELLEYQRRELAEAQLRDGEADELLQLVQRLAGGAKLLSSITRAHEALTDDESGALQQLGRATGELGEARDIVELEEAAEQLLTAHELARDAARSLERFVGAEELDPRSLDRAQERLHLLETLQRKYGRSEFELIDLHEKLEEQLEEIPVGGDGLPAPLAEELNATRDKLGRAAQALDRSRRKIAKRVEQGASRLLPELAMPGASLRFDFQRRVDPNSEFRLGGKGILAAPEGISEIRLFAKTNAGTAEGAVDRIASGGELARIALVLRSLANAGERPALLILDEIDAGLGADLGEAVARRLRVLADGAQLLVISHLPAVAAAADRHFAVTKGDHASGTEASIEELDGAGRERELIRMLGGQEEAREHVQRLLRDAAGGGAA